jgi:rhodanese-related sulfurtransferase
LGEHVALKSYHFKSYHFISIFIFILLITGCLGQTSNPQSLNLETPRLDMITQAELTQMINEEKDLLLIDVRTEGEYTQGHLPGAIVIPYDEFDLRYKEILEYQDREVVLYCHTGGMGDFAGKVLLKKGFTNVKNLDGGIYGWINSGGKIA